MHITPVILSGGSGTRVWPLSRASYPKQFLNLHGEHSLLQQTLTRLNGMEGIDAPIIIAGSEQRFLVAEQLHSLGGSKAQIVLEPVGRNTAPAVAVAALLAAAKHPDALILVLPSDHIVTNPAAFRSAVSKATHLARDNRLVTFGITPTSPNTGYGYIKQGAPIGEAGFEVEAFVEKPDTERAAGFLADGRFAWNSGMFLFKASVYLSELERLQPAMLRQAKLAVEKANVDLDFLRLDAEAFAACKSDSIDYAVMEQTDLAAVVPAGDFGWSDIGSWTALAEVSEVDEDGNTLLGDVVASDTQDCYVRAENRLVATIGVQDLVVVETKDAVLVVHKDAVQNVKDLVSHLNGAGREEGKFHCTVHRPWGSYEGLDEGERFQVKRIVVKPGGTLSLQMHYHRAEHWIVVRGTARVTCGDKTMLLSENQSTYIPLGEKHRLENPGRTPLELIEVQSGTYLGEDDIVRFDDAYGRTA
jgi:mannose-1-phosphate guanylyltransferase/mannose-6-phosphate isomerase